MEEISIPKISIIPEYFHAARQLTNDEYQSLRDSIKEHGLRDAIVINVKGIVLDGHNRLKACNELGLKLGQDDFIIKQFDNELEEHLYVHEVNLLRRQLTGPQRVEKVSQLKPIYEELAKLNMSKGGKGASIDAPLGRVNKILASKANVSQTYFDRTEYVLKNSTQAIKKKILMGKIKPHKEYYRLHNNNFLKAQIALNKKLSKDFLSSKRIDLRVGDFLEECSKIKFDSIDLIYTDPLYDEKHLYLYDGVGKIGIDLLRPGGSLITYINQAHLFTIGNKLLNAGLTFWWPIFVIIQGNESRIFDRHTIVDQKPLLWFVKGPRPINPSFPINKDAGKRNYLGDLVISHVPDKRFHDFGQSPEDAEYFMKFLTAPNDRVLDPFVGGGSTAVAAMNMKRQFIGIDIDPMAIEKTTASLRMNDELKNVKS